METLGHHQSSASPSDYSTFPKHIQEHLIEGGMVLKDVGTQRINQLHHGTAILHENKEPSITESDPLHKKYFHTTRLLSIPEIQRALNDMSSWLLTMLPNCAR
jgi:hypothetical protein